MNDTNTSKANPSKKIVIAIDGYSSCGKSTMARKLAAETGYRYIDSGAMYRAVTLYAMRHGMTGADGSVDAAAISAAVPGLTVDFAVTPGGGQRTLLNDEDVEDAIRGLDVAAHVSAVAAIPAVRHRLTALQQQFGADKGIVMDGRDIGTTVFPHAEMKVFVTAAAETRARRRYDEMAAKGTPAAYEDVLANVRERDRIDETRAESPLRKADDAVVLDNSDMSIAEQDAWLLDLFKSTVG